MMQFIAENQGFSHCPTNWPAMHTSIVATLQGGERDPARAANTLSGFARQEADQ